MIVRRMLASAPGKLILMGEHAVVYGHPALVSAIDRRLRATLETGEDGVLLRLPNHSRMRRLPWSEVLEETQRARGAWESRFLRREETPSPAAPMAAEHLVVLALGEAVSHLGEEPREPVTLTVDSDLPVGAGFGSSAALAAAVAGVWLGWRGRLDGAALAAICLEVERRQHGTPSGVDHTAVLRGGLLEARRGPSGEISCEPLAFSPLFERLRVFDSGTPNEPTGAVVASVRQRLEDRDPGIPQALEQIARATHAFREELLQPGGGDHERAGEAIRSSQRALEALGVVPEEVRMAVRSVERAGGFAKVSGAGALSGVGAGSVLVYCSEAQMGSLRLPPSWRPLEIAFGAPGLEVSSGPFGEQESFAGAEGHR